MGLRERQPEQHGPLGLVDATAAFERHGWAGYKGCRGCLAFRLAGLLVCVVPAHRAVQLNGVPCCLRLLDATDWAGR